MFISCLVKERGSSSDSRGWLWRLTARVLLVMTETSQTGGHCTGDGLGRICTFCLLINHLLLGAADKSVPMLVHTLVRPKGYRI